MPIREIINTEEDIQNLSLEEYYTGLIEYDVIATEGLMDFFRAVGRKTHRFLHDNFGLRKDVEYKEANRNRKGIINYYSKKENRELTEALFLIPDYFRGHFPSFITDLASVYTTMITQLDEALPLVKRDIAVSIKNIQNNEPLEPPTSLMAMKELDKTKNSNVVLLSSYFKGKQRGTLIPFLDVFKSGNDVVEMFKNLDGLEMSFDQLRTFEVKNLLTDVSELTDELVNALKSAPSQIKNSKAVKETTEVIYTIGRSFEFIGALHAYALQVYGSVAKMSYK